MCWWVTCVCCRVMENNINAELLNYLYLHGLISKCQRGFLHKHSTCTNLLESVYDWSVALNNKLTTVIIYIDFQKAFDSVSHSKHGDLLALLKAFLSNRTQVVNVEGCFSDTVCITSHHSLYRQYQKSIPRRLPQFCLRAVFWVPPCSCYL